MAFPTRHWRRLSGQLAPGARLTAAHGLRDGRNGTAVTPDAVLNNMEFGTPGPGYTEPANVNIGCYADSDTTNVYLSNWGTNNSNYSALIRSYWSGDDTNQ